VSNNKNCARSGLVNVTICEGLGIQRYKGVSVLGFMNIEKLVSFCVLDLLNNFVSSLDYIVPNIGNTTK